VRTDTHLHSAQIPIFGPCRTTTTGFKWNVDCVLVLGGLISSSNEVVGPVTVRCDQPLLLAFSLQPPPVAR